MIHFVRDHTTENGFITYLILEIRAIGVVLSDLSAYIRRRRERKKSKMKCRKCIVTISLSVTIMALITMSAMAIDTGLREIDKNKASSDLSFSATQDYTGNAASAKVLTGTSIPEYPTVVIPLLMILGLFFYSQRKRQIVEGMNAA